MPTARFEYLFARYWERSSSDEERAELMALVASGDYDADFKTLVDQAMESTPEMQMDEESAGLILQSILAVKPVKKQAKIFRIRRTVAAAAAIAIITAAYFFFFHNKKETKQEFVQNNKIDVAPGGNHATLTLGNGKVIVLDSAGNGKIAQQGNSIVVKTESGKLEYNANAQPKMLAAVEYNTLSTPRGGQQQLTLPDGSRVWLNAASSIKYPTAFTGTERNVEITGEAYFEVAKDARMPFVVSVNTIEVRVLGTHFNINAYSDEPAIKTTLLEGSIRVSLNTENKTIRPGEQAICKNQIIVKDADTYQAVAWMKGQFEFDNLDLPAIMRQVSRWYDVEVSFESSYPGAKFGGGISRNLSLSHVLGMLEKNGVHTKMENRKIIVLP